MLYVDCERNEKIVKIVLLKKKQMHEHMSNLSRREKMFLTVLQHQSVIIKFDDWCVFQRNLLSVCRLNTIAKQG